MKKKQVILVDHNEKSQAVDGIGGAEILEIIDHHRLGSLETISPVFFRNQPLGCTSTIIYQMYQEKGVKVTKKIAGLLCSAIISDTLMFRSPTCTVLDRQVAEELAQIAGIQIEEYAKNMFQAGSDFKSKSPEEIFYQDFKTFFAADMEFGVGQISAMSQEELDDVEEKLVPYLDQVLVERKLSMVYVMLTNILEESTWLLYHGEGAGRRAEKAFRVHGTEGENKLYLKGVVSRKKQFIPPIMVALQEE
jgi:manganese-dependent inorganic pyrophosphatase